MCQLQQLEKMALKNSYTTEVSQTLMKYLRKKKSDFLYTKNCLFLINKHELNPSTNTILNVGDRVKVRTKEEITFTLDLRGKYENCAVTPLMWQHCDKEYRVFKIVENFYDEVKKRIVKCRNTVILEGVYCEGNFRSFKHNCDRNCFLMWKTAWLEKIL